MSSLFDDGCLPCHSDGDGKTKCKGGVCELLNQLANQRVGSLCALGQTPQLLLVNKGTDVPLALGGTTTPTLFSLVRYDPKSCCAVLTYQETVGTGQVTRTYVTDCRALAGVSCLNAV
ncbi:hypothetical protein [Caenibacillus caldisaponilyticus]|uniref:hypothetical protein n=1 Tax=Caenibacillus caldisaponilyticus TaxID=1674942 RepID=UPI0009882E80|nr:hypothetical protein [Caenibacillus caldisaponilyticus]